MLIEYNILQEIFNYTLTPSPIPQIIPTSKLISSLQNVFNRVHDIQCGINLVQYNNNDKLSLQERRTLLSELTELGFNIKLCEKAISLFPDNKMSIIGILNVYV